MTSVLSRSSALTARNKPSTGDTKTSFVNVDHLGWLNCNGRALDKTTYNLLFQVIAYTFGGSGNTFNLPDFQGRVQGSVGTIVETCGTTAFAPGTSTGEVQHKLTIAEMPAHNHNNLAGTPGATNPALPGTTDVIGNHTHGITDPGHAHSYVNQVNDVSVNNLTTQTSAASNSDINQTTGSSTTGITINPAGTHSHNIASNGGDGCHNNMQPTLFYGNTFIYSGIPMNGTFPFTTGLSPVLI